MSDPTDPPSEPGPDDAPEPSPGPPRRYPSTVGGALYLAVLAVTVLGVGLTWGSGDWRLGVRVVAGALAGAAVLRLLLPGQDAGMLAVRRRWLDVVLVGGVAAALFVLTASIPDQPV